MTWLAFIFYLGEPVMIEKQVFTNKEACTNHAQTMADTFESKFQGAQVIITANKLLPLAGHEFKCVAIPQQI